MGVPAGYVSRSVAQAMCRATKDEMDEILALNFDLVTVEVNGSTYVEKDSLRRVKRRMTAPSRRPGETRGRPRHQAVGDLIPTAEAARLMGRTISAFTAWHRRGVGPKRHYVDGRIYYSETEILDLVAAKSGALDATDGRASLEDYYTSTQTANLLDTSVIELIGWTKKGTCPEHIESRARLKRGVKHLYLKDSVWEWRKAMINLELIPKLRHKKRMTEPQYLKILAEIDSLRDSSRQG